MARGRPFFSGNYGGSLGSFDTAAQLIAQSGKTQGDMFANLGKTVASTLDDFRAKKEKREKEKAAENQFLRMYDEAPTNPIFGSFGIQNREEAEAAAKDIAKDPSLVTQAMQFAQTQMSLEAKQRGEQERQGQQQFQDLMMGTSPQKVAPSDSSIRDFFAQEAANDQARGLGGQTNPELFRQGVARAASEGKLNPEARKLAMNRFLSLEQTEQAQTTKRKTEKAAKKKEKRETTTGLRKEFTALPEVKEFSKVRAAYNKVKEAGEDPSPAGDLSLIFNYMKILDPGSVVREGEFANAQNATGVPGKIVNFYNQVVDGTRLSPTQRQDFLNQSRNAARAQFTGLNEQMDRYRGIAERNKLPVEDILPENLVAIEEELSTPITTPPDTNQNQGASSRRIDATPSTQLPQPAQQPAPSPSSQNAIQTVLDKAASGEALTPKEQQLLDLLRQRDLQNRPPQ